MMKFFVFLLLSVANACFILIYTEIPEMQTVAIEFENSTDVFQADMIVSAYPTRVLVNAAIVEECIQRVQTACPSCRVYRSTLELAFALATQSSMTSFDAPAHDSSDQYLCPCELEEKRPIKDLIDWKRAVRRTACNTLPVTVSRDSIIADAVGSFESFKNIISASSNHLYYRNVEVSMEAGIDQGGPRAEFLNLFFHEIIHNSPYFNINPQGYVVLTPGQTTSTHLNIYEAFGFYLAKAVQNEIPINAKLSKIITEMIRFGKLALGEVSLIKSWDLELANSLRAMSQYDDETLANFDFKDIYEYLPSIPCTKSNVACFNLFKMQQNLKKFNIQLIMISLGFIRACPPHVAVKLVDLNSHIWSELDFTAQDVITAFRFDNSDVEHPVFKTFAKWLESLNPEQLKGFFRYITGFHVLPKSGLGALNPRLSFRIAEEEDGNRLPHANTCRRILYLPSYRTEGDTLEKLNALMILIESGDAFGFGLA